MKKTNSKKIVKKITGILAAATIAASSVAVTAVSVSASGPDNNRPVVCFEPCGNWSESGAQMKAYFFNSRPGSFRETWQDMKQQGDKLYTVAPAGYDTVVFTRQNPVNNEIWNKTYDLTVEEGKTYKATSFEGMYYKGEWQSNASPAAKEEVKGAKQINFTPSNEWKNDGARFMAYFYKNGTDQTAWVTPGKISPNATSYSVNVPDGFTHVIFVRLPGNAGNDFDKAWNKTPDLNVNKLSGTNYTVNGWELDKDQDGANTQWY